ncbi:MAG TPA: hypothetical protein DDW30_09800 [Clostridiales bacterium]|nr:hypothetical protein [Clostridiales bacterium]
MKQTQKLGLTRALAWLLLLLLMCTSCAMAIGCNVKEPDAKPSGTTAAREENTTAAGEEDDYPQYDKDFRIMHRTNYSYEFLAKDSEGANVVNDAVYSRNQVIEKRYNVTIKNLTFNNGWKDGVRNTEFEQQLSTWMTAQEDACDLIAGYHRYIYPTVSNDWYLDWQTVPGIDLKADEWQNGINEVLTINGKTYAITGDITLTFWKFMSSVVFNDRLAKDYASENLYSVVSSGKWTLEYMMEVAKEVPTTGEGVNRIYGFGSDIDVAIDAFASGFGVETLAKDNNGVYQFQVETEKNAAILDKLVELYTEGYSYQDQKKENDPSKELFTGGQVLFNPMRFEMIERLRDMSDNYGVLPYPKLDKNQQNYRTAITDGVSLMFVPKTVKNAEMVGTVTAALAEQSRELVNPRYIEVVLKGNAARDSQSLAMIDLIRNNVFIDPGYVLTSAGFCFRDPVKAKVFKEGNASLSSFWSETQGRATTALEKILAYHQK